MGDTGWVTALRRLPLAFSTKRSATLPVLLTARSWWLSGLLVTVAVTVAWPLAGFLEGAVEGWGILLLVLQVTSGVATVALALITKRALPGRSPVATAHEFSRRQLLSSRLGGVVALMGAYLAMRALGAVGLMVGSGCAALILALSIPSQGAIERLERKAAAAGQPIDLAAILASTPTPAPSKEAPRRRSRRDKANP
jgi:hypothetical protein